MREMREGGGGGAMRWMRQDRGRVVVYREEGGGDRGAGWVSR